jgi:hypothetical protein
MFFSFDYAAWGAWPESSVISLLQEYRPNGAYFHYNGKPLASTFEGPDNAGDWTEIKRQTGCFFIPDWSSKGPSVAAGIRGTDGQIVADGLFSWDAWPEGANDMTTAGDNAYILALGSTPYMMPVSPWFFTDLPGYSKNWVWRGDDLWYDRWQQVLSINPQFVEIITWNDYGESHYIGPLRSDNFGLFGPNAGKAPYNYAANMPHDALRTFLPYVIDTYKNGNPPPIPSEQVVTWYRVNPNTSCSSGGTTGNNPSYQTPISPTAVLVDAIYYSALLTSDASVSITVGGITVAGTWRNTPAGGSGIYHGSVPFNGMTGPVTVRILRTISGQQTTVAQVAGVAITTNCQASAGQVNWNAWTGASTSTPV